MPKKPVFNPEITRIKLNPEQAVLICTCYNGRYQSVTSRSTRATVCSARSSKTQVAQYCTAVANANKT